MKSPYRYNISHIGLEPLARNVAENVNASKKIFNGDKLFLSIELLLDANQLTSNQIYGRVLNTLAEVSKHVEEILESHGK